MMPPTVFELTADEVATVRQLAASGCRAAAKALGVREIVVARIVAGVAIKPELVVLVRDGIMYATLAGATFARQRRRR
ncbi:MAG: hypothetical protein JST00_20065 [Deltaproteobacteria bacterium]|nr:hypothetical protein [Deltaproteobacteria bacterium]